MRRPRLSSSGVAMGYPRVRVVRFLHHLPNSGCHGRDAESTATKIDRKSNIQLNCRPESGQAFSGTDPAHWSPGARVVAQNFPAPSARARRITAAIRGNLEGSVRQTQVEVRETLQRLHQISKLAKK